jgi:hypothetical protein
MMLVREDACNNSASIVDKEWYMMFALQFALTPPTSYTIFAFESFERNALQEMRVDRFGNSKPLGFVVRPSVTPDHFIKNASGRSIKAQ